MKKNEEPSEVKPSEAKAKKFRKPSLEQMALVRQLWEAGIGTKQEIAADAGLDINQVRYLIDKHNWQQGCRMEYYEEKARAAIESEISEKAKQLVVKRDTARDQAVKISSLIESRMISAFKHAQDHSLSDETMLGSLKSLELASRINSNTFHTKRFALGMDKEDETLNVADNVVEILEMTADEVESIRNEQERAVSQMDVTEE